MDFGDSPEQATYRARARAWVKDNAPHHLAAELERMPLYALAFRQEDPIAAARSWQRRKQQDGWAASHWPADYGGSGATPIERVIWDQEEGVFSRLSQPFAIGIGMCGPTLMGTASEAQKQQLLPAIASGGDIWCQLFSEPGAGSDLANVATRAVRHGDSWLIDGQKVWTSSAHHARYGLLLARTDPTLPKHHGLTMFFIDMDTPGVEVRPIHQMNGGSNFSEVYFTGVAIPDAQRLGPVNGGWRVSVSTLMHERLFAAMVPTGFAQLFALCRQEREGQGRPIDDPVVRSRIARWATVAAGLRNSYFRSVTSLSRGEEPGPEASIGKLAAASTMQEIARYALDLLGDEGMLASADDLHGKGWFQSAFLRSPALRIEAGSDEILRNIIAERVLGLPPEPRVDRDLPFNQQPT